MLQRALRKGSVRGMLYMKKLPKIKIQTDELKTKKIFANYIITTRIRKLVKYYEISKNDLSVRLNLLMLPAIAVVSPPGFSYESSR